MCWQDKHKTAVHACSYQCCMRQSMLCQRLPLVCPKRKAAAGVVCNRLLQQMAMAVQPISRAQLLA